MKKKHYKFSFDNKIIKLNDCLKVQGEIGNWDSSEYMLGLYNGMEFCLATLEERDPSFRTLPIERNI